MGSGLTPPVSCAGGRTLLGPADRRLRDNRRGGHNPSVNPVRPHGQRRGPAGIKKPCTADIRPRSRESFFSATGRKSSRDGQVDEQLLFRRQACYMHPLFFLRQRRSIVPVHVRMNRSHCCAIPPPEYSDRDTHDRTCRSAAARLPSRQYRTQIDSPACPFFQIEPIRMHLAPLMRHISNACLTPPTVKPCIGFRLGQLPIGRSARLRTT